MLHLTEPEDPNGNPVQVCIRVSLLLHGRVALPDLVVFILGDTEKCSSG